MLSWTWEVLALAAGINPQCFIYPLVRLICLCAYALRSCGTDTAIAWLCLSYALSEDAPTGIEHHSPPSHHPQLMQNLRVPGASCQLLGWLRYTVSIITFSYISGLGASGRLSTHICTYPCILCPLSPFSHFLPSCRDTPMLF